MNYLQLDNMKCTVLPEKSNSDLEPWVRGHPRSLELVPFEVNAFFKISIKIYRNFVAECQLTSVVCKHAELTHKVHSVRRHLNRPTLTSALVLSVTSITNSQLPRCDGFSK